jgi:hypothetical protein
VACYTIQNLLRDVWLNALGTGFKKEAARTGRKQDLRSRTRNNKLV